MLPRFFSIVLVLSPFVIGAASIQGAEPRELTNSIGMKLVRIEPGSFMMGQDGPPSDYHIAKHPEKFDDADWDEKPAHRVTITRPFHMGATEVTLAQTRDGRVQLISSKNHYVFNLAWLKQLPPAP